MAGATDLPIVHASQRPGQRRTWDLVLRIGHRGAEAEKMSSPTRLGNAGRHEKSTSTLYPMKERCVLVHPENRTARRSHGSSRFSTASLNTGAEVLVLPAPGFSWEKLLLPREIVDEERARLVSGCSVSLSHQTPDTRAASRRLRARRRAAHPLGSSGIVASTIEGRLIPADAG